MANYCSLRCNQGESALNRIERGKTPGDLFPLPPLPADAFKGGIKKDFFGNMPPLPTYDVLGDVTEHSGKITYYIYAPKRT